MKKIGFVNVMMMVFAILAIFLGAYVFHRATYAFSKTNGGNGIVMAMNDFNYEMNEYKQLADDLEEKYFSEFCDAFEDARERLLISAEDLLGDEYKTLKNEVQTLTADLKKLADDMSANDALNALKDRLTDLKERLIKAPEDEKDAVKAEMKGVLSEITRINLDNFALLSKKRREIDALNDKIKAIVQSKKDDLKDVEAEVLSSAREMVKQTVFAYGAEAEALAKAFGVKDYRKQPYFLSVINPELKLVDFNKDAIIKAVREKRERDRTHGHDHDHAHGGCDSDCENCLSSKETCSVYDAKKIDKNDN